MTVKTRKPRKVLTSRQYDELCRLVTDAQKAARAHESAVCRRDSTDDERKASLVADYAAYEAVVKYVAALTKWT